MTRCYQSCKDKNFKAIHNHILQTRTSTTVVINLAKIKILKQFTTLSVAPGSSMSCYQSCKDKNFKAIHNCGDKRQYGSLVVINLAKIKILKQFTTLSDNLLTILCCYQSCKDKNFKAIHNDLQCIYIA